MNNIEKFELENRYIVIKRKDLREMGEATKYVGFSGAMGADNRTATEISIENFARKSREKAGKPYLTCLVIESDWPEYPIVLQMLKDRVEAKALQSSEPVAEVGTYMGDADDAHGIFNYQVFNGSQLISGESKLFTHPPASVPLEKYNKLLDALRDAEPHVIGEQNIYRIQKAIAEAEGKRDEKK